MPELNKIVAEKKTGEIEKKIKDWEEWCEFDEDRMNDHIRDFFADTLARSDLFEIIRILKCPKT